MSQWKTISLGLCLAVLLGAAPANAQESQVNPALTPFHTQPLPGATGPQYNPGNGPAGPGTLTIPQIMPVKRPLRRRPLQPIFDLGKLPKVADPQITQAQTQLNFWAVRLKEAKQLRDNRATMRCVLQMERARQRLLGRLRQIAPIKKSFVPLPQAKPFPSQPAPAPPGEAEKPLLPMPTLPSSGKSR